MKKILFIMNTMGRAGAEIALIELLKRIDRKKYQCDLFVLTGQGEMISSLPEGVRVLNKRYYEISVFTDAGRRKLTWTCIRALFKRGNIIRLFPYLINNLIIMLKNHRIIPEKLMWRVLSDAAERFDMFYDLAIAYNDGGAAYYLTDHVHAQKKIAFIHVDYTLAGYTRRLDRDCYCSCDKIYAVSDEVMERFVSVYHECKDKTDIFNNYINKSEINEKSLEEADFSLLERLAYDKLKKNDDLDETHEGGKTDENEIIIVSVGRLMEQKKYEISIEACEKLREKGEKIKWFVIGEGNQRKKLEKMIIQKKLEHYFFLPGIVENPYPFLAKCDLYVHCSKFEGKSIAVQEAQILGRPIIVSDCSGNRGQILNEVDGLICDLSAKKMAEAISSLIHDKDRCVRFGVAAAMKVKNDDGYLAELLKILN